MNKLPFPVRLHDGLKLVVTQPYGNPSNVAWYKENGITMPFHNGVDVVLSGGDNLETYGTEVITPSAGWVVKRVYWYEDPLSPNGNEVVIHSSPFVENGITKYIELRMVHLSGISKNIEEGMTLPAFTTLGYIGNSGLVLPKPTPESPCSGSHLHLGMCVVQVVNGVETIESAKNGVYGLVDPLTRLDIALAPHGEDTGIERDVPAFKWALQKMGLSDPVSVIIFALKNWWNGK